MVRNVKWLSSLAAHNQRAKTSAKQRMDLSLIPSFDKLDVIDQESVQFDIRASSVVERLPVILPEPSIEEKQFEELQEKLSLFQEAVRYGLYISVVNLAKHRHFRMIFLPNPRLWKAR